MIGTVERIRAGGSREVLGSDGRWYDAGLVKLEIGTLVEFEACRHSPGTKPPVLLAEHARRAGIRDIWRAWRAERRELRK